LAISKNRKEELVAEFVDLLENSRAIFLTDYTGLPVSKVEALRTEIYKADGAFRITKNTLLTQALRQMDKPELEELLQGPTGTSFALGEVPSLAKALVEFAKKEELFSIKGGLMGNTHLTPAQITALAELPSLDELRAQLVGLISAPARNVVSTLASGVRQVVNVIDAYAKKSDTAEPEAA